MILATDLTLINPPVHDHHFQKLLTALECATNCDIDYEDWKVLSDGDQYILIADQLQRECGVRSTIEFIYDEEP